MLESSRKVSFSSYLIVTDMHSLCLILFTGIKYKGDFFSYVNINAQIEHAVVYSTVQEFEAGAAKML